MLHFIVNNVNMRNKISAKRRYLEGVCFQAGLGHQSVNYLLFGKAVCCGKYTVIGLLRHKQRPGKHLDMKYQF